MGRHSKLSAKELVQQHRDVLRTCQTKAVDHFSTNVSQLFENSESALLDFADEAGSNQFYTHFLESINLIKSNHEKAEEIFQALLDKGFNEFIDGENLFDTTIIDTNKPDQLQLIDQKDMNENVAVEKIISRIRNSCFQELYAIGQRLSLLHESKQLKEHNIPAGPHHVVKSFQHAVKYIPVKSDIRIILLAILKAQLTKDANYIYHEMNELLAAAGLFPNLKPVAKKSASGTTKQKELQQSDSSDGKIDENPPQQIPQEQSAIIGKEVFNSICKLLGTRRSMDPEYHPHPGMAGTNIATTMALVDTMDTIQQQGHTNFSKIATNTNQQLPDIKFDSALLKQRSATLEEEREQIFAGMDRNEIPTADMNMIEVVGMMFEFALSDDDLPNIVKVLISHLHTPYLKVALLDRNFLVDSKHVARQLLNLMAKSGSKWVDEQKLKAGIYFSLERHVDRILHEFQDDLTLFDEIFAELGREVEQFKKKVEVIEIRAKEAEKGKERLTHARTQATEAINDHIGQYHLPVEINDFLYHPWLDRMILTLLRDSEAEQSSDWNESIEMIETLAWASQAEHDSKVKEALRLKLPQLKRQIIKSLAPLGEPFLAYNDDMFKLLSGYLATSIKATQDQTAPTTKPPKRAKQPTPKKPAATTLSTLEEKMVRQLKNTGFNTWFLFTDIDMQERELKLSWSSRLTGKFMFVDHYGTKVMVIPIEELASLMCDNKAKIIAHIRKPFVDRAMNAIRNTLNKAFGKKEQDEKPHE